MKWRPTILFALLIACVAMAFVFRDRFGIIHAMAANRLSKKSVADRLHEFGSAARGRMKDDFAKANVPYPPASVTLVVLKDERRLEVYAGMKDLRFVHAVPILAASGGPGPKLREGDRQVPEGVYEIELLNPNSSYHVSLRLNYPNQFDQQQAAKDGRTQLGGDIMIHGKAASIGCVAIGDTAAEEIFTLATDAGLKNIKVISSPVDLRHRPAPSHEKLPAWCAELYARVKAELAALPPAK